MESKRTTSYLQRMLQSQGTTSKQTKVTNVTHFQRASKYVNAKLHTLECSTSHTQFRKDIVTLSSLCCVDATIATAFTKANWKTALRKYVCYATHSYVMCT